MFFLFFFQAEDGIRDLVRSRGLGDVYKRQLEEQQAEPGTTFDPEQHEALLAAPSDSVAEGAILQVCLLYTSDAADERSSVDLGGRRIIKKKKNR